MAGLKAVAAFSPTCVGAPLVLALMLGLFAAAPSAVATPVDASTTGGAAAAGAAAPGSGSAAKAQTLCFEAISGPPGRRDVEQLRLVIAGRRVSGEYHWIPWGKDRRLGRLDGNLRSTGQAQVVYRYVQEGQRAAAPLTIQFTGQQARISWDPIRARDPSAAPLPPAVLLPHQACSALKSPPRL